MMDKLLPTIADMPDEEREIVNCLLTDLVHLARERFMKQLAIFTDTEIRLGLITLWEHNLIKADMNGDYIQWMLYKPSNDSWIRLPASKAYLDRIS
ncbi:hypothetical protein MUP46_00835 [Patescibacteria group bacterium]|nr:hypothetical protein [Patescibacteria group bacterium]